LLRGMPHGSQYDDFSEQYVIENWENPAARTLGEGVRTGSRQGTEYSCIITSCK
jgi:hypothetical protein